MKLFLRQLKQLWPPQLSVSDVRELHVNVVQKREELAVAKVPISGMDLKTP